MDALPGCDLIGCGYDVLNGFYCDARSCRSNLFTFSDEKKTVQVGERSFEMPKDLTFHAIYHTKITSQSGQSIHEYIMNMKSKTKIEGEYNFFSASVETDIGIEEAKTSENAFSKVSCNVYLFYLQLPVHPAKLLNPDAKNDIDNMDDLTQLFDDYGTHYMAEVVMGGVANYTASTKKSSFKSKYSIGVVAKMSFKAATGSLSAEEKLEYENDIKSFNESSKINLENFGGDPALGGDDFPQHVNEWEKSVFNFTVMVDYLGPRSLTGIWELASTEDRKKKIHDHYPRYCELRQQLYDTPLLQVKEVLQSTCLGTFDQISIWRPDVGGGWYYLGHGLKGVINNSVNTFMVREVKQGSGILGDIADWELVHNNVQGINYYSFWRGVPVNPVDYVVLTDLFTWGWGKPDKEQTAGIKAVHRDYLVHLDTDHLFGQKFPSLPHIPATVWAIQPVLNDLPEDVIGLEAMPYFVGHGEGKPQNRGIYALRKSTALHK